MGIAIDKNDLWEGAVLKVSEVLVHRHDIRTYILRVCGEWLEAAAIGIVRNIVLPCNARSLQSIENGSHVDLCEWLGHDSC